MSDALLDKAKWPDPWWRLSHLYTIVTDEGQEVPFVPNEEQRLLYSRLHNRNLVLKARQLGFTAFIDLMRLDQAPWRKNFTGAIIAHSLNDAARIFRAKMLNPYRALPQALRDQFPLEKETASELIWKRG